MSKFTILVECEVSDDETARDIVTTIETVLPYMADNVVVSSQVHP